MKARLPLVSVLVDEAVCLVIGDAVAFEGVWEERCRERKDRRRGLRIVEMGVCDGGIFEECAPRMGGL